MHFADGIRYGWGDWWFLAEGSPEDALDVARAHVPAGLKDHGRGSSISRTKDFVLYVMTKPGWVLAFPQQLTTENGSIISLRPCELELETVVRGDNVVARLLINALERGGRWPSWAAS
jgi:hypothetical protein